MTKIRRLYNSENRHVLNTATLVFNEAAIFCKIATVIPHKTVKGNNMIPDMIFDDLISAVIANFTTMSAVRVENNMMPAIIADELNIELEGSECPRIQLCEKIIHDPPNSECNGSHLTICVATDYVIASDNIGLARQYNHFSKLDNRSCSADVPSCVSLYPSQVAMTVESIR